MQPFPFKKVVVPGGGSGFLGSHVVDKLRALGIEPFVPRRCDLDLIDPVDVAQLYKYTRPDLVINCAAVCGGIGYNQANPATIYRENILMGLHLLDGAFSFGVQKFINVGTVCSYPAYTPVPFKESDLWSGYPEPTNAPYGLAKKALIVQSQAYREQFGFNSINLLLANLYGPRDHFEPARSHVIPALIKKCVDAIEQGSDTVTIWGTGEPTREFLYVEDAADAILKAAIGYDSSDPVNIGTGREYSIRILALLIAEVTGYKGAFEFDTSKPDGQMSRRLDISKAKREFGFEAFNEPTEFRQHLKTTLDWYLSNRSVINATV